MVLIEAEKNSLIFWPTFQSETYFIFDEIQQNIIKSLLTH